jgi:hypothetical protein
MASQLLHQQASLIDYLTSRAAIFAEQTDTPLPPALYGIDCALLNLEAQFTHQKRMDKISAVFARTFTLLGAHSDSLVRDFAQTCPPVGITRLENARQFFDFLCARLRNDPRVPPYIGDIATCEFACAQARVDDAQPVLQDREIAPPAAIRRHPNTILLRASYDIRPMFEGGVETVPPPKRDTPLGVTVPPGSAEPKIFELVPPIFHLLSLLDDWSDASEMRAEPELNKLIGELVTCGLIEVRH